jgi:hypothetical protein
MQMRVSKIGIEANRFFELAHCAIPVLSLGLKRAEGIVQDRIFGSSIESALRLGYRSIGLLGASKCSYIENHRAHWQRTGFIPVERSKPSQRFFVIARLFVGDGKIDLGGAIAGLERQGTYKFANCLLVLAELHKNGAQRAMPLSYIWRQADDFLKLLSRSGKITPLFRGVARVEGCIGGSKLLLRALDGRQTGGQASGDK